MTRGNHATRASGGERSRSLWILDSPRDLLLFVATPLLILPVFLLAQSRWSVEEIALFVFAFGQIGHQLPGLMRAYGDRELFRRHKLRFIIAPLALLAVSGLFIGWNLHGLVLIAAVWGIWHALMQTYGMLRIYDAKVRSFARTTQRLDLAMCLCWFVLPVLLSPGRLVMLLDLLFQSGGPLQAASLVAPLTQFTIVATTVVTAMFLINLCRSWRRGSPPNPVKLILMVTSFGFFWYTSVTISNVILGLVMFEVFHDVQYFAIVWVYNRNRVKQNNDVGGFTRFLFRRSGALAGIYVGLIFAYGSLHYIQEWTTPGGLKHVLTALLATSGLLHYYYDGFIWKLRDKRTRESLELSDAASDSAKPLALPNYLKHVAKWGAFAAPALWLFLAETSGVPPKLDRYAALREAVPNSALVRLELGAEFHLRGDWAAAEAEYRTVVAIEPRNAKAFNNLGLVRVGRGDAAGAIECYLQSLAIAPKQAEVHNNLGNAYVAVDDLALAQGHFRKAIQIDPRDISARNNLALTLAQGGKFHEAERQFRQAIRISPSDSSTHYNLANLFAHQKDYQNAAHHFQAVLKLDPENETARRKLDILKEIERLRSRAKS